MASIEQSIDVHVPVRTAYDQWTQFEEFPRFMESVKEVHQLDDDHVRWVAEIGGVTEEWDAQITEQHPDHRIAWRATSGRENGGVVTFHKIDDATTRVMLQMNWEPDGLKESVGATLGIDERSVKADLERFREMIEGRGRETGAWRGDIENDA